jgi:hypothetical protein
VVASDTDFRPEGVAIFRKGDAGDLHRRLKEVIARPNRRTSVPIEEPGQPAANLWRVYLDLANSHGLQAAAISSERSSRAWPTTAEWRNE